MKRSASRTRRKLHSGHFAFMRAVVQGVDARAAWERYLRTEGVSADIRTVRSTIAWIRAEFAAAAKREAKPRTARLVLIDASVDLVPAQLPTLEEFAAERGMTDFSEAEQAEAYEATYSTATKRTSRRAQLVRRQLTAIRWLEDHVSQDPKPGDACSAWLTPALAERIERAGSPTLFALIERINDMGARWWTGVPGIGELKASRIVDWLVLHEKAIGMTVGQHARKARMQLQPAELAAVVPATTALVPLEKFRVPAELDGSAGEFRGARDLCLLNARNDYEAIKVWLASKRGERDPSKESPTQRAYRKEAERLLLWAILVRGKALSSLSVEDAAAYALFIEDPPAEWCGHRYHQRWSPQWRPFEGPLQPVARRQTLIVLRSLYSFLVKQNYMVGNPFEGIALPPPSARALGSGKVLSFRQWDFIRAQLGKDPDNVVSRRRDRALRWLYATGLRLTEMVNARCSHLEEVEHDEIDGETVRGWMLNVLGKGQKPRRVPVPDDLVDELGDELALMGRPRSVSAEENKDVAILARFSKKGEPLTWSDSGLYKAIQAFMKTCALQLDGPDAKRMMKATTHWLRHTHATHALRGRRGHAVPVDLLTVRDNLGHSSIATTSGYLKNEERDRLKAMKGFWGEGAKKGN